MSDPGLDICRAIAAAPAYLSTGLYPDPHGGLCSRSDVDVQLTEGLMACSPSLSMVIFYGVLRTYYVLVTEPSILRTCILIYSKKFQNFYIFSRLIVSALIILFMWYNSHGPGHDIVGIQTYCSTLQALFYFYFFVHPPFRSYFVRKRNPSQAMKRETDRSKSER